MTGNPLSTSLVPINLEDSDGKKSVLQVSLDDTVSSFESALKREFGMAVEKKTLIYGGLILKDDEGQTLRDYVPNRRDCELKGDGTFPMLVGDWELKEEEKSLDEYEPYVEGEFTAKQKRLIDKYPSWTKDCITGDVLPVDEIVFIMLEMMERIEKEKEADKAKEQAEADESVKMVEA
ncbi:hypothetical protein OROGR_000602 [Orobanche gracilis]